jgi:hypothetical protein
MLAACRPARRPRRWPTPNSPRASIAPLLSRRPTAWLSCHEMLTLVACRPARRPRRWPSPNGPRASIVRHSNCSQPPVISASIEARSLWTTSSLYSSPVQIQAHCNTSEREPTRSLVGCTGWIALCYRQIRIAGDIHMSKPYINYISVLY